jgi:hypothetical protein
MAVWEYKFITSGKGGFATPVLLESFLNQLGKEEWEIIRFQSPADNPLAFTGLARRPTQRDWTLEDAVATAARAEADKLRAEFAAKFKEGAGAPAEEKAESIAAETAASDDGLRKLRDTESDLDPDAAEESEEPNEWDQLAKEDELPTFFEALRPHLRRNQRGPGLSVGVDYLAKKWQLTEKELVGALKECGLNVPEDEDAEPAYVEYDGDLFWVNMNRRGELWINTKEKPRPAFRVVQGKPVDSGEVESPEAGGQEPSAQAAQGKQDDGGRRPERRNRRSDAPSAEAAGAGEPGQPLPAGPALLDRIGPLMRRNRRGAGISGSTSFLARALKCTEADLVAAFNGLGLSLPADPDAKPVVVEIGDGAWWLNQDQRGGVWINGREKSGEAAQQAEDGSPAPDGAGRGPGEEPAASSAAAAQLAAVRLLLKPTKTGAFADEAGRLAEALGKSREDFLAAMVAAGLKLPEKAREKPVFVEHAGEIFWLNKSAKDELWLNAKPSKYSDHGGERRGSRSRARRGAADGRDVEMPAPEASDAPAPAPAPEAAPSAEAGPSA